MAEEEKKDKSIQAGERAPEPPQVEKAPVAAEPAVPKDTAKADIGKRAVAAIIDVVISYIVGLIPVIGWLIGAAYMALRDGLTFDPLIGQSLGKKLLNLKAVVMETGENCDYVTSIKRNLPFIIPQIFMVIPVIGWIIGGILWLAALVIEVVLVITDENGERLGDKIAGTKVIELKA